MQLKLKRVEAGLHQQTLGTLLGGATQALIGWWESGGICREIATWAG